MAKIMTLSGSSGALRAPANDCKCIYNPRTKRFARLCFVGKGPKSRSGYAFVKGAADFCKR